MDIFVFDLLAYGENLDHLKTGKELPHPQAHEITSVPFAEGVPA